MGWFIAGVVVATWVYSMYLQSNAINAAQKPGDIPRPTASEGIPIPVIFGTREITDPNITWFGDLTTEKDGNTFKYYAGLQFALCHGKLDAIYNILVAGRISSGKLVAGGALDPVAPARDLTNPYAHMDDFVRGLVQANLGAVNLSGTIDDGTPYYPGTDDYLAKHMSLARPGGGEDTKGPRYYGVATVTAQHCWIGNSPYLKPWSFLVSRIHTRNGGADPQWYDEKAEIRVGATRTDLWKYKLQQPDDNSDWSGVSFNDSAWPEDTGGFGNAPRGWNMGDWNSFTQTTMDYPVPVVNHQFPSDGFWITGTYPNSRVYPGLKIWLRKDLGRLTPGPLNVRCYHDDSGTLWFNGTQIQLIPLTSPTSKQFGHFNSVAQIPEELVNPEGPNIVAYRVRDTFDNNGKVVAGSNSGNLNFIYAGITVGIDANDEANRDISMNGVHIVRECITDKEWGMGYPDSRCDEDSFRAAADTLYDEGFGLSFEWNRQSPIGDFIDTVLKHISGVLYVDRSTGKFVIKLIREDYNIEDLVSLDEKDIVRVENASRKAPGELINEVVVTYSATPRGDKGSVAQQDEGGYQSQDGTVSTTIDYEGVRNPYIASRLCVRDLRMLSSPLFSGTIYASRKAAKLTIGAPFLWTWPDLNNPGMICRVSSIKLGDHVSGEVQIDCVEDVFSFPKRPVIVPTIPIAKVPPPSTSPVLYEVLQTAQGIDSRNEGGCETAFNGGAFSGSLGTVFEGWTEISPGVMERNSAGPLSEGMFDGINPFTGVAESGYGFLGNDQWGINRRVFAITQAAGQGQPGVGNQYQGPYILADLGGYWAVNEFGGNQFYPTKARMYRDPSFSQSSDFVQYMMFQIRLGATFGGDYVQLQTANVNLGYVDQVWNHIPASSGFSWNNPTLLLRPEQINQVPTSPDSMLEISATGTSGFSNFGEHFRTLTGTPNMDTIPAGPWRIVPPPCYRSGGDVGAAVALGISLAKASDVSHPFITVLTENIDWEVMKSPSPIVTQSGALPINREDLVLILSVHTNSSTPLVLHCEYNNTSAILINMPKSVSTTTVKVDESLFDVWIVDGLISNFGDHRKLRVHGTGPLRAIAADGLVRGTDLLLSFVETVAIDADNAVTGGAPILTSKDGEAEYQDKQITADSSVGVILMTDSGSYTFWKTH